MDSIHAHNSGGISRMCGIAGFLSNGSWDEKFDSAWLEDLANNFSSALDTDEDLWSIRLMEL